MGANDAATRIPLSEAIAFSAAARVNKALLTASMAEVRMNCYEPGQATPMHMHPDEDEVLLIVEGQGTVTFEVGDDLPVRAGDLVCLPADRFHRIAAGPDGRMVLIYFMKPGYESVRPGDRPADRTIARLPGERPR